ncbi:T-cell surface glycoprotein CD8 alpha chain isoform X4 [Colossoma macropomum]|uniref:T-cell surface glycoprotein CD8 alpha chain isoform X4 n=1 Tax=Colossoma macropomum TaxID=42526 RepID=UPI0018651E7E|nr:T-cell surface glycoprotein CD8 alpha chain isoform X4 [Colossoma macropomum]
MFGLPTGPLLLLFLFHGACSETMKEGEDKDIPCDPKSSGTVWWFRLINNAQLEFIASFSSSGDKKVGDLGSKFDHQKMKSSKILTLKGFKKETDSGSYSCATINNNKLLFGSVTSLRGTPGTTLGCELVILISLAAGNGLLLILLIITILYCNRMRTRQCPHHYKRDSQSKPAGHRPLSHQTEL